jgi:glycosyltransferase involved in cell wall biosynthesis
MNKKYLVNGFGIHFKNLEEFVWYSMDEYFPTASRFDIITNFYGFLYRSITWKFKKYDIIHINNWENFLNFWSRKWKVMIGESHWFHFWLNFWDTLKHFNGAKKIFARIIETILVRGIHRRIRKFDLYYVSTPNMLKYAKKIRIDTKWLPNSIDLNIFIPEWKKAEMKWNPVIFYPTRLHSFKNPKFWIELFHKIKEKYPDAVLHLIHYPNGGDAHYLKYRNELINKNSYVWHNFKTKEELAEMFRASDIVLWHFHQDLWMMSLVELQAVACKTPVISYDKYEIKTYLKDLETITFDILWDRKKREDFVIKNKEIVLKNHSAKNIAKELERDISRVRNRIYSKKTSKKLLLKYMDDILKIENQCFHHVWIWNKENFLSEYYNKFQCSYLLFKWDKIIGYIIWHTNNRYWYVNRLAVSQHESWQWLWSYLMTCFNDNLKYNLNIDIVELVTHDSLSVESFYLREWYKVYKNDKEVMDFLLRKWKKSFENEYLGVKKFMKIFYKYI